MLSVVFILFRFKYNREPNCRNVSFHLLFVLPDFGFYGFYRALLNWPFFYCFTYNHKPIFFFIYSFNRRSLRIKQYFLLFTIFNIITKIELNSITHSNSKVHAFDSEEEQKSWVNRLKCQTNPIKIINYNVMCKPFKTHLNDYCSVGFVFIGSYSFPFNTENHALTKVNRTVIYRYAIDSF